MALKQLFVILFTLGSLSSAVAATCLNPLFLRSTEISEGILYETYDGNGLSEFLSEVDVTGFPYLAAFQEEVRQLLEPIDRIEDSIQLMRSDLKILGNDPVYGTRIRTILSGKLGQIRSINCLEAFLMDLHLQRPDLLKNEISYRSSRNQRRFLPDSEFQAWILQSKTDPESFRILIAQSPWVVAHGFERLKSQVDLNQFILFQHFHNHPFAPHNKLDTGGNLTPSGDQNGADVGSYIQLQKELGLKKAVISNGFHSLEIQDFEFSSL